MEQIWQIYLVGIFGLVTGSFLNVLIYRLNEEGVPKFWQGRSFCPKCRHPLSWTDNIPLLSFLLLKGSCRYCGKKISFQYPLVEILTAVIFVLVGIAGLKNLGDLRILSWTIGTIGVACSLIVIFFSDWIYGLIPDEMILAGSLFVLLGQISQIGQIGPIWQNFTVGLFSAGAFFLIVLLTRFRGMGLGDVKLAFLMGFLLGFPKILVALWSGFIIGGTVAIILLLLKRRGIRDTIPLGPYLVLGTIISALWTNQLLGLVGL